MKEAGSKEDGARLSEVRSDMTNSSIHKLRYSIFHLNVRGNLFAMRMVK